MVLYLYDTVLCCEFGLEMQHSLKDFFYLKNDDPGVTLMHLQDDCKDALLACRNSEMFESLNEK